MTQWAYFIPENKIGDREMKFVIMSSPFADETVMCFLKTSGNTTALANEIWLSLKITAVLFGIQLKIKKTLSN